ncbi:MAG: NAD(P)H-binding protein [Halobacteriota archaeon]
MGTRVDTVRTGGTGFIRTRVVTRLSVAGHEVVALSRDPARVTDLPDGVTLVEGDLTEKATLREPMDELAETITGVPAPRSVPPALFGVLSRLVGLVEPTIRSPDGYESESIRALAGPTYFGDNAKATRELGVEHRPLEAGLREYFDWEMEQDTHSSV